MLNGLVDAAQKLTRTPGIGGPADEYRDGLLVHRKWSYLIFYEETSDGIRVVRVLHGARDVPNEFD